MTAEQTGKVVAVVSGDFLPYPGYSTSGGGLRAWNLGEGLRTRGHDIRYLMPSVCVGDRALPDDPNLLLYDVHSVNGLARAIEQAKPDVVVVQQWHMINVISHLDVPIAVDLHGPMILEAAYSQPDADLNERAVAKIRALQRADFFTCAGDIQKKYFLSWLMLAGIDLKRDAIFAMPVSVSPELPEHTWPDSEVNFVFGGQFLPWQDPSLGLLALVEEMERLGKGRLDFFGGVNKTFPCDTGVYAELEPKLADSTRVRVHGRVSRDVLTKHYLNSYAALDVMSRNYERELAFTTRTVEYLWCGLPVVYADYGELASYIREYEAGWIVAPDDKAAIGAVLRQILTDPAEAKRRSANAQRLVRDRLTWDRTIAPLDAFCKEPARRQTGALSLLDYWARHGGVAAPPPVPRLRYQILRGILIKTGLMGLYRKTSLGFRLRLRAVLGIGPRG